MELLSYGGRSKKQGNPLTEAQGNCRPETQWLIGFIAGAEKCFETQRAIP